MKFDQRENIDEAKYDLDGKRILLVEDHPVNVEIIKKLLEYRGITVECAEDGGRGVEMFTVADENYYDAILMDIKMPVMDGLQATKAIRHLTKTDARTVPIIAMTANAFDEDVNKSKEVGMNLHLTKPIEPKRLYMALDDLINK